MKKFHILFLTIFISYKFVAQSLPKVVLSAAGQHIVSNNLQLSFTVGQSVVGVMRNSSSQISNGYHSGLDLSILKISNNTNLFKLTIYPNPTSGLVHIFQENNHRLEVYLYDLYGKNQIHTLIDSGTAIDIGAFSSGIYTAKIIDFETNEIELYKIIKK